MCGIFACSGSVVEAAEITLAGLKTLEYRGYDSWGVAWLDKQRQLQIKKQVGKIGEATLDNSDSIGISLGHTRWATHGGVTVENAHPHISQDGSIVIVHNGIVENFAELKTKLLAQGYLFTSQTDTEVVANLIAENHKTMNFVTAVQQAFLTCTGLNAFVALDVATGEMIVVKNGSPLVLGTHAESSYLASDATALSPHTSQVYFLADHDLIVLKPNQAPQLLDLKTLVVKPITWEKLSISSQSITKGDFSSFLEKKIHEQPGVLLNTLAIGQPIKDLADLLAQASRVYFVACGTASYAGLFGAYMLSEKAGIPGMMIPGSEFAFYQKTLRSHDLVVFLSQSGETIDVVEIARELLKRHQPFVSITNRLGSTLERMSQHKIMLPAGPEMSVLATKSFTAKISVLYQAISLLCPHPDQAALELKACIKNIEQVLKPEYFTKYVKPVAELLSQKAHIFVLGKGTGFSIALEAAIKIKEVTYVHTEAIAAGELKHGTIALIEKGTPCIIINTDANHVNEILSSAAEVKSRGAVIIGISQKPNDVFDHYLPVFDQAATSVLPAVIVAQLLAFQMSHLLGTDPDKPRNLAKSVTVK